MLNLKGNACSACGPSLAVGMPSGFVSRYPSGDSRLNRQAAGKKVRVFPTRSPIRWTPTQLITIGTEKTL